MPDPQSDPHKWQEGFTPDLYNFVEIIWVSFRMDGTLKKQTEDILGELKLNMTTVIIMFAKAIVRERRLSLEWRTIPLERIARHLLTY